MEVKLSDKHKNTVLVKNKKGEPTANLIYWGSAPNPEIFEDVIQIFQRSRCGLHGPESRHGHRRLGLCRG